MFSLVVSQIRDGESTRIFYSSEIKLLVLKCTWIKVQSQLNCTLGKCYILKSGLGVKNMMYDRTIKFENKS